jgi:hypothetical protein
VDVAKLDVGFQGFSYSLNFSAAKHLTSIMSGMFNFISLSSILGLMQQFNTFTSAVSSVV